MRRRMRPAGATRPAHLARLAGAAVALLGSAALATAVVPQPASASTGYALNYVDGKVLRWNPCHVVHYRVNLARAPWHALADVEAAVSRVAYRTGLRFHYDGTTSVVPQSTYGARSTATWAPPLVFAWARPGTGYGRSDVLATGVAGEGGWRSLSWSDAHGYHRARIVTGYVVLNSYHNSLFRAGYGSGVTRGELLLHELGHAVGLRHVGLTSQTMYPTMRWRSSAHYGWGDAAGLAKLGAKAGCIG